MSKVVYILSGLGADHRVFRNIDFGEYEIIHVPWLQPLGNESLESYAKRIVAGMKHEKPFLVGLSFGGMLAMELAKIKDFEKIFLISSSKTKYELPFLYRLSGILCVHKIIPTELLKALSPLITRFFGAIGPEENELLRVIIRETDKKFLKWSIAKICTWKNKTVPKNVFQVHGSHDRILPLKNIYSDVILVGGGHFMVLNRAEEISLTMLDYLGR